MRCSLSLAFLLLFTVLSGCLAGNDRSERTARSFAAAQARRAYLNWQWANHFQRLRMDQETARQGFTINPDGTLSRRARMQLDATNRFNAWRQNTAPRFTLPYPPPRAYTYRRR